MNIKIIYPLLVIVTVFWFGCQKDEVVFEDPKPSRDYPRKVPLLWNQLYLKIERFTPGYKPPVSARNMAYINLSAYEAVVPGSAFKYKSMASKMEGFVPVEIDDHLSYNWEVCAQAAYEKAFELFFPTAPAEQQFQMLEIGHQLRTELELGVNPSEFERSYEYGQRVAEAIYQWSMTDTWGHEGYLRNIDGYYFPPEGTGNWKPTYPDFAPALLPHWGKVRTFSASNEETVADPPAFDTNEGSQLNREARITYDWVNKIKAGQDEESY
ncbi:MAG: hypothetical protein KDC53_15590, partial [Saprospiraceae bacterium]|nr:hypothetical protein [Saprospiraceae bacterium]